MSDSEPTLGALIERLRDDSVALIKAEVVLVRAELTRRARLAGGAVVPAAVALIALHTGMLVLALAAVVALAEVLGGRLALASVLVGVAFVGLAVGASLVVVRAVRRATAEPEVLPVPGKFLVEVIHERSKR